MNKIRLLKASSLYQDYLDYLDKKSTPNKGSYSEQLKGVLDDRFGWSDYWKRSLESTGQFDVCEVLTNHKELQMQWAAEAGLKYDPRHWLLDILDQQVATYMPDVLFFTDFGNIPPGYCIDLKKKYSNIKMIIGWDGVGHNDLALFEGYDLILSSLPTVVDFYKAHGYESILFRHGFSSSVLPAIQSCEERYAATFTGSVHMGSFFHNSRMNLLAYLAKRMNIDVWTNSFGRYDFYSKEQIKRLIRRQFSVYADIFSLSRYNHGGVFGADMFNILASSKITLNCHIDASRHLAGNVRLFEATGAGACLVTDFKDNLSDYFLPDKEVITYKTPEEAWEKIQYLVEHESYRKSIALAGQRRTLKDHSVEQRIQECGNYLLAHL